MPTPQTLFNWMRSLRQVTGNDSWHVTLYPSAYVFSVNINKKYYSIATDWESKTDFKGILRAYKKEINV